MNAKTCLVLILGDSSARQQGPKNNM